ncbi:hypothetical protein [Trueperella pecoris]|uniref:Uncharacterized protein n=1 Tax=Trueperella pecoris TaxID=2733571 RepID=A0A7M1QTS3_9ACTO|nr:hypothetical protein [Trueperella pecoris]QOR44924.1 hypothetical protein INS88_06380 [Trueperella pecoris]
MGIISGIIEFIIDATFISDLIDFLLRPFRSAKPVKNRPRSRATYGNDSGALILGQVVTVRLKGHGTSKAVVVDPDAVYLVRLTDRPGPGVFELSSLERTKVGRQYAVVGEVVAAKERWCRAIRGQKRLGKADFEHLQEMLPRE